VVLETIAASTPSRGFAAISAFCASRNDLNLCSTLGLLSRDVEGGSGGFCVVLLGLRDVTLLAGSSGGLDEFVEDEAMVDNIGFLARKAA
jgi:hypothetical protein